MVLKTVEDLGKEVVGDDGNVLLINELRDAAREWIKIHDEIISYCTGDGEADTFIKKRYTAINSWIKYFFNLEDE